VTHNNALSAFHDLKGVDVLTSREMKAILQATTQTDKIAPMDTSEDVEMTKGEAQDSKPRCIHSSQ
jgi:hypothetical protein